jgi:hypothetical protein
MTPSLATENLEHSLKSYSVLLTERRLRRALGEVRSKLADLYWSHLSPSMSPLLSHIHGVFSVTADPKVPWVAADPPVTLVANTSACWNRAVSYRPRQSMSKHLPLTESSYSDQPVTYACPGRRPVPAIIRPKLFDFRPKSHLKRDLKSFHKVHIPYMNFRSK